MNKEDWKKEQQEIKVQKEKMGVKCKCDDPFCGKCLAVNCKDDNCPVHTKERKEKWVKQRTIK